MSTPASIFTPAGRATGSCAVSPPDAKSKGGSKRNPHTGEPCVDCQAPVQEGNPLRHPFASCQPCDQGRRFEDMGLRPMKERPSRGFLAAAKKAKSDQAKAAKRWPYGAALPPEGT